jgi:Ca2+-transporting ATPase
VIESNSVTASLDVAHGLSQAEAARRLAESGRNELLVRRPPGVLVVVARQLTDTVILVLLAAAVMTAIVGDGPDTAVILAVVVINTALGASQEMRSERTLAALAELTAPRATVIRDGEAQDIDAGEVVSGDLLRLAAGDVVPADATLVIAEGLQLDESMLTGESIPTGRQAADTIYAGTVVTRGRGEAVVTAVAEATALGSIARSLRDVGSVQTPVQRQLAVLGRRLAMAVSVAAVLVAVLNLAAGRSAEVSLVLAISLAVAAIPESLPAVVSLSVAMAARRMADRGVLARRLAAVEALGSVTIIASDKTGTLTEGRMAVNEVWTPPGSSQDPSAVLQAAVLCSDACDTPDGRRGERDDPTEVALVDAARDSGIDIVALRHRYPRLSEEPFDAVTARMTTVHADLDGGTFTLSKGAPERLLAEGEDARAKAEQLALAGLRVLAITRTESERTVLIGLVALSDPVRTEARSMIDAFAAAGVRPVMITGDHPATARAVGEALNLISPGDEVQLGDTEVGWKRASVYARVRPEQKTAIVREFQSEGEIVAMTGDGVNDAPALRAADIGIAMGNRGTEVAKRAADLVLTGDDLSAMIPAIAEGRRAYDNLRRFLHYALSGGIAEVIIMLAGPVFGFSLPLQAGQILWVNLLTHGLPGVAMGSEPAAANVLARPPRSPREQLLDAGMARRVGVLGVVIAAASLVAGGYARSEGRPWQSTIFIALAFAQLVVALALRPRQTAGQRNPLLLGSVILNVGLAVLAATWSPLQELLRTERLTAADYLPCIAAALVAGAVARLQVSRAVTLGGRPTGR